ncbi:MAG: thiamine phosphate synthase [Geminicoccaceae bacterium]
MSSADAAEAGRRLFLISPPRLEPARFGPELSAALGVGDIAGFLLRLDDGSQAARAAGSLRPVCAAHGVAFLVEGDVNLARECGADGVHLRTAKAVAAARAALGAERLLGASCGTSRHAAMVAGEEGADYIAFGEPGAPPDDDLVELVRWWSEVFVLPCLVEAELDEHGCGPLVRAGADLIGASAAVFDHPDGAAVGVLAMQRAIETA